MRVAMYYSNRDVRLEEMPRPQPGPGEVLIKIHASGICGSDVVEWYRRPKAPRVLGHEIAGEVVEAGKGVGEFAVGDRVFATHHVPCGTCHYCRLGHPTVCDLLRTTTFDPGGFSEFVRVPAINVQRGMLKLPDAMSYEEATFIEPLGCVVRGQNLIGMTEGVTVLVIGSGLAGLLHAQLARARGCRVIALDINPERLEIARRFGIEHTFPSDGEAPEKVRKANQGRLADRIIVCTEAPAALHLAFGLVERGGTILFFAPMKPGTRVDVPLQELWWQGVTMTSSYAASLPELREAVSLMKSGQVDGTSMVTHRLPLDKTGEGFRLVEATESLKVIIEPQK
jgi:L-iditol 2-dehydrogenase